MYTNAYVLYDAFTTLKQQWIAY